MFYIMMKLTMNSIIYNSSVVPKGSVSNYNVARPSRVVGLSGGLRMNLQNPMLGRIAGAKSGCGCGH